jgi:hypothetical protein
VDVSVIDDVEYSKGNEKTRYADLRKIAYRHQPEHNIRTTFWNLSASSMLLYQISSAVHWQDLELMQSVRHESKHELHKTCLIVP